MSEQTSIPVSKKTHRIVKAHKENHGGTYDQYLRQLVSEEREGNL